MGYSSDFLRGILSLWMIVAVGAVLVAALNELFGLGLFAEGYPVAWEPPRSDAGFWAFAAQSGIVVGVALALSALVDRING